MNMKDHKALMANIAHEIRTPITVITGYSKALCDGIVPEGEREQYIRSIYQRSVQLSVIMDQLVEYSKLECPEYQISQDEIEVCEGLRLYLVNKYSEVEVEGFSLDIDIPEEEIYAIMDRFLFSRVIENLVTNSIRHNKPGTTIFVYVEKKENVVELHFGDDGVGIEPELRKEIFQPFVVGDDATAGSGLGLSLTKRIIEAHNGTIEILEQPREGWSVEFVVSVPISTKN